LSEERIFQQHQQQHHHHHHQAAGKSAQSEICAEQLISGAIWSGSIKEIHLASKSGSCDNAQSI